MGLNAKVSHSNKGKHSIAYLVQKNKPVTHSNNSRSLEYLLIAYLHDTTPDGTNWIWHDSSNQYTYDQYGNELSELDKNWNGAAWINSEYDSSQFVNNDDLLDLTYFWSTISNTWVNGYEEVNVFDTNDNFIADTGFVWNPNNNTWVYQFAESYTYDTSGNELTYTEQNWNGVAWEDSVEYLNTYNTSNLITRQTVMYWINSGWAPAFLNYYYYDGNGNNTSSAYLIYNSGLQTFNNFAYDTSTYANGSTYGKQQLTYWMEEWVPTSSSYIDSFGYSLAYDGNGNNTYELDYYYNDPGVINTDQWFYYYQQFNVSSGIKEINPEPAFTVYPNPAANLLNVQLGGLQADELRLYNISGQLVVDIKSPHYNQVDVSSLCPGVYIAEVVANNTISRMQWIKM